MSDEKKGKIIERIIKEIEQYPFPKSCISKKDKRWNTYNEAYNKAIDDVKEFLEKIKNEK